MDSAKKTAKGTNPLEKQMKLTPLEHTEEPETDDTTETATGTKLQRNAQTTATEATRNKQAAKPRTADEDEMHTLTDYDGKTRKEQYKKERANQEPRR